MKLIACYGSLKKGYYNNPALGEDAEFMGEAAVRAVMYSNGSYPKLYKINNARTRFDQDSARDHILEVYNIDEKHYSRIEAMELGAGYVTETIETPYGEASIWYMPHEHFDSSDKWVEKY